MTATVACAALVVLLGVLARRRPTGRRRPGRLRGLRLPSFGRSRPPAEPVSLLQLRTAVAHGASLVQAFDIVAEGGGPWADGARRVRSRVRAGAGLQPALDAWVTEDDDPSVALAADALAIASSSGGSLVRAIDAVVAASREQAALQREVRALASQARASAAVLVLMPLLFAAGVSALDPRIRSFFVASFGGPVCLATGVALDAAGWWWMQRLVRRVA